MLRLSIALLSLTSQAAFAGCYAFVEPLISSDCTRSQSELSWRNPGRLLQRVALPRLPYDRQLYDATLAQGLVMRGDLQFELRTAGIQLLEVFLVATDSESRSYTLEAEGKSIDSRQAEAGRDPRAVTLVGLVNGPFTVRSTASKFVISAIRWTTQKQFEEQMVPAWLERTRQLAADPFFEDLRAQRRENLEQLFDRLALSERAEVRREAVVGQARMAYWLAAETRSEANINRADSLFRAAVKLAPKDQILREVLSSSCSDRNVRNGHMLYGGYCVDIAPVPWSVVVPPDPPDAPEWAVTERRVAARLEAITKWWVERRQQPDGEIGGGWRSDVEILSQWGAYGLGLGSSTAATGIRKMADGIWASGLISGGYDKEPAAVERSSQFTDTQPLRVALDPAVPGLLDRLRETAGCARNWIAQQPDGNWRFPGFWFNCTEVDKSPDRAFDVALNVNALGPALWYAYFTRDRGIIEPLANLANSWVTAMRSTENGKPAGIFPSVLKPTDGSYPAATDKPAAALERYRWSGESQESLTSLLLALHDLTGEVRWLEAAGESFQILNHCQDAYETCEEIRKNPQAFYEWRRRSGDARYDAALRYTAERLDAEVVWDMAYIAKDAEAMLSRDFDMYTSEVIYPDLVYYPLNVDYKRYLFGGDAPRGDRYPNFAVTWPPAQASFARAVIAATSTSLRLRLYSFEAKPAAAQVRVWRLEPGKYEWTISDMIGSRLDHDTVVISRRAQAVGFRLPPGKDVELMLQRVGP